MELEYNFVLQALEDGNDAKAFKICVELAVQGDPWAQWQAGVCFQKGIGTDADLGQAFEFFELSANQGFGVAEFSLAVLLRDGRGRPQDRLRALQLFTAAAIKGLPKASASLGAMYSEDGDYVRASYWSRIAAHAGNGDAQHNLGLLYLNGHGIERDTNKAAHWFRLAAVQRIAESQFFLGMLLIHEGDHRNDIVKGLAWLNLAAVYGFPSAIQERSSLEAEYPFAVADAKTLALSWLDAEAVRINWPSITCDSF